MISRASPRLAPPSPTYSGAALLVNRRSRHTAHEIQATSLSISNIEARNNRGMVGAERIPASGRVLPNSWKSLVNDHLDRVTDHSPDESGRDQDVIDELLAALIDSREVLSFGHQGCKVPEPLLIAPIGPIKARSAISVPSQSREDRAGSEWSPPAPCR